MFYALSWFFILGLFALWSMAAWATHAVAMWAITHTGSLSGALDGAGKLSPPAWIAQWVPPELVQAMTSLLSGLAPLVDRLIQSAPALAGDLTDAIWVIWGVGGVLLVLLGVGLHLLIARLRRSNAGNRGDGDLSGPGPQAPRQVPL